MSMSKAGRGRTIENGEDCGKVEPTYFIYKERRNVRTELPDIFNFPETVWICPLTHPQMFTTN